MTVIINRSLPVYAKNNIPFSTPMPMSSSFFFTFTAHEVALGVFGLHLMSTYCAQHLVSRQQKGKECAVFGLCCFISSHLHSHLPTGPARSSPLHSLLRSLCNLSKLLFLSSWAMNEWNLALLIDSDTFRTLFPSCWFVWLPMLPLVLEMLMKQFLSSARFQLTPVTWVSCHLKCLYVIRYSEHGTIFTWLLIVAYDHCFILLLVAVHFAPCPIHQLNIIRV